MKILSTQNLSTIHSNTVVNITANAGECWAILGRNGVGKTTLLHTLAGLQKPSRGEIFLAAQNIMHISRLTIAQQIAVLLQQYEDHFPITVLEILLTGRYPYATRWQLQDPAGVTQAKKILHDLELAHLQNRLITTLSGGERQRVALATVMMQTPKIYLLDEPTNHLDLYYQTLCLNYLQQQVQANSLACMMVLQDINLAMRYCSHAILLFDDGRVLHGKSDELLHAQNLQQLYRYPLHKVITQQGTLWAL